MRSSASSRDRSSWTAGCTSDALSDRRLPTQGRSNRSARRPRARRQPSARRCRSRGTPPTVFGTVSRRMVQGSRSSTFQSTAALSRVFNTVRTLLTVLGVFVRRVRLSCCTFSVVIASSRLAPSGGVRCSRKLISLAAMLLGFCRFVRACPGHAVSCRAFTPAPVVRYSDGGHAHRSRMVGTPDSPRRRLALMDYMLGFWLQGARAEPMLERHHRKPAIMWEVPTRHCSGRLRCSSCCSSCRRRDWCTVQVAAVATSLSGSHGSGSAPTVLTAVPAKIHSGTPNGTDEAAHALNEFSGRFNVDEDQSACYFRSACGDR